MSNFTPSSDNPLVVTIEFELTTAGPTLRDLQRFIDMAKSLGAEDDEMLSPRLDQHGEHVGGLELLFITERD